MADEAKKQGGEAPVKKGPNKERVRLHKHRLLLRNFDKARREERKIEIAVNVAAKAQNKPLNSKEVAEVRLNTLKELYPKKAQALQMKTEQAHKRNKDKLQKQKEKAKAKKDVVDKIKKLTPEEKKKRHQKLRKEHIQTKIKKHIARRDKVKALSSEEKKAYKKTQAELHPKRKPHNKKCGRLYVYALFTGYRRGMRNSYENTALLKVNGATTQADARWYCGKKAAFVYKAKNKTPVPGKSIKNHVRVIWGKVTRPHGKSGGVRAKFAKNLPSSAFGKKVRIMLYPSHT